MADVIVPLPVVSYRIAFFGAELADILRSDNSQFTERRRRYSPRVRAGAASAKLKFVRSNFFIPLVNGESRRLVPVCAGVHFAAHTEQCIILIYSLFANLTIL